MPEYLAPGVFVEETTFRQKSVEGVSTSTAAFVGLTARGPVTKVEGNAPPMLTRFSDFERVYGGFEDLRFADGPAVNHMAHAVRVFFDNGGGRLYVARILGAGAKKAESPDLAATVTGAATDAKKKVVFKSRNEGGAVMPGGDVNMLVTIRVALQAVTLASAYRQPKGSVIRLRLKDAKTSWFIRETSGFRKSSGAASLPMETDTLPDGAALTLATLSVVVEDAALQVYEYMGLGLRAEHPRAAHGILGGEPPRLADKLSNPVELEVGSEEDALVAFATALADSDPKKPVTDATTKLSDLNLQLKALEAETPPVPAKITAKEKEIAEAEKVLAAAKELASLSERTGDPVILARLKGGSDGTGAPSIDAYKNALEKLGALEDISIIASPGCWSIPKAPESFGSSVIAALIAAAEKPRAYRIAVLDSPPDKEPQAVRELKGQIDSKYAALYYPWVMTPNPLFGIVENQPAEVALPPSGFVCGVYARTDVERGVWKAPANETVRMATRLQRDVSFGEQELLNPLGVNCIRLLPNRGFRIWGARTTSSDPEWKYVNIRRYFLYLEASIDRGMQWAVFEPNGERLWANVRQTVSDFLYNEWINGALLGSTPKEAFFVRCDRSTMTQNDLDNGRLICLIGVAAIKPAEFVVFRIGQKTVDAKA